MRIFDDFTLPGFWQDPFPFYQHSFQNSGRIQASPDGGIAVLGYEESRLIGMHPAIDGTPLPPSAETQEPPLQQILRHGVFMQKLHDHKLYRRAALSGLNHASIKKFEPRARHFVERHLARAGSQTLDVFADICLPLAAECWTKFVGYGEAEADPLTDELRITGEQLSFAPDPARAEAAEVAAAFLLSRTTRALTHDQTCPMHRMADVLGQAHSVPMITSLLFDAIETTAAGLAGMLAILMNRVDDFDAFKDPSLREDAIEEALRLATPTPFTVRQAREDVQIGELDIKAGTMIWMWWSAANRDPDAFPEPARFLMGRAKKALPFGIGPHTCLGHGWTKQLAHLLVENALTGPQRLQPVASDWSWKIGGPRRPDRLYVRLE